jgi:FtsP/CotA-like multicopper oxidase with cupredoxin domain
LLGAAGLGAAAAMPRAGRSSTGALHDLTLVAAERPMPVLGEGAPPSPVWTYDPAGMPVVRVRKGDRVRATLVNGLPEHTSVHWHGLRVPNAVDGVPFVTQEPVRPGGRRTYEFDAVDSGTFFFHPHCNTVEQLGRGLAGVLVVEGDTDERPFDADLVLAVRDFRVDGHGRFLPLLTDEGASRAGTFGTLRTVNGQPNPTLEVPTGGDVRLRLLNVDNTRVMEIGIEGAEAALVAVDGNALDPAPLRSWRLGPAMRVDLAVRAPKAGGSLRLVDYFAPEPVELARLVAVGAALPRPEFAPWPLAPNRLPEPDLARAERLRLTFSATAVAQELVLAHGEVLRYADALCLSDRTFWAINKTSWPEDGHQRLPPPLFEVARGRTQLLELVNATPHMHPIHLHGHFFKVLKGRRGTPLHWADTVLLGPRDRAQVAFVADNPGDWMLHCHVIEHQETGMMAYYRVA